MNARIERKNRQQNKYQIRKQLNILENRKKQIWHII